MCSISPAARHLLPIERIRSLLDSSLHPLAADTKRQVLEADEDRVPLSFGFGRRSARGKAAANGGAL